MKHIITRTISILLITTLMFSGVPATASANSRTVLASDYYQAADVANQAYGTMAIGTTSVPTKEEIASAPQFATSEEAGLYLREQMKAHSERIVMSVPSSGTKDTTIGDVKYLCKIALAHTGVGTEGDYLVYLQKRRYGTGVRKGNVYSYAFDIQWRTTVAQEQELDGLIQTLEQNMTWGQRGVREEDIITPVYDYIMSEMTYDEESCQKELKNMVDESTILSHTAYAAMTKKTAVCSAFAMLMYRILLDKGVDCRILSSNTHAWNAVECAGEWYECDVTAELQKSIRNPKRLLLSRKSMEAINSIYVYNDSTLYDKEAIDAYQWATSDWYSFAKMTIRGFKSIITYASSNKKGKQSITITTTDGVKLVEGIDYKLSYDGENLGNKSLQIIGIGEYEGITFSKDYTVKLATPKITKIERIFSKDKKQVRFKITFTKVYGATSYSMRQWLPNKNETTIDHSRTVGAYVPLYAKDIKNGYTYTLWHHIDPSLSALDFTRHKTTMVDFQLTVAATGVPVEPAKSKFYRLPQGKNVKRF